MKEIVQQAVDVITDKSVTISVDIKPTKHYKWWDKLLLKIGLKSSKVEFKITRPVVGTRFRIAPKAMNIPDDVFKKGIKNALWKMSKDNKDDLIYIIALCIQNNKHEPHQELLEFIEWNFDDDDILTVLNASLGLINIEAFTKSTILIKGAEILSPMRMGPMDQEELIAPGVTL